MSSKVLICLVITLLFEISLGENKEDTKEAFRGYENEFAFKFFSPLLEGSIFHHFDAKMLVPKGGMECFFEICEENSRLMCGFQSDSPSTFRSSGLVSASLRYPNDSIAEETEHPIKQGAVQITCPVNGHYQFCVDNSHDRYTDKMVGFQITIAHPHKQVDYHAEQHENTDESGDSYLYSYYDMLYQVCIDMTNAHRVVKIDTAEILRDWELMKENSSMITVVSFLSMLLTCSVGYGQIYLIKKLFIVPHVSNGKATAIRT